MRTYRDIGTLFDSPKVRIVVCILVLSSVFHNVAVAQEDDSPGSAIEDTSGADAEARAHYMAGQLAFDQGRFDNALDAFQRAYSLSQRPELLYNIGSAADRLRQDAVALDAFERYLELVPHSQHANSVRARIGLLRRAVEDSRAEGAAHLLITRHSGQPA